jgi:hypothetical protein
MLVIFAGEMEVRALLPPQNKQKDALTAMLAIQALLIYLMIVFANT